MGNPLLFQLFLQLVQGIIFILCKHHRLIDFLRSFRCQRCHLIHLHGNYLFLPFLYECPLPLYLTFSSKIHVHPYLYFIPVSPFFASEKRHSGEECRFSGEIYVLNVAGEILTLDASHCHALDNVLGKEQVYDDNREDRECNRYIHLTHIKLQEVCGTQLSDQDR